MLMSTDRIEKEIVLRAPRSQVWRALTKAEEFGEWFGARLQGAFTPGARVSGRITIKGYDHLTMEIVIDRVEPEHLFSYRWHPYAVDPAVDYSHEPMTLVEFQLHEVPDGTRLTVVESGFDRIPADRRATAFRMNEGGWTAQMKNIERYVGERAGSFHEGKAR
ncbi:MAG: SRPBCC family protein [Vicinamibacterales bacterium]